MSLLGVDVNAAPVMVGKFRGWGAHAQGVIGLVQQAETLSGISTGATAVLDQVTTDARAAVTAIQHVVGELTSFRVAPFLSAAQPLTPQLRAEARAEARDITQRLRYGNYGGGPEAWAAEARDSARLRQIFKLAIGDPASEASTEVSEAAHRLALLGYPVDRALRLDTQPKIDQLYEQIAEAVRTGQDPSDTGLAHGLFPAGYRAWRARDDVDREDKQGQVSGLGGTVMTLDGTHPSAATAISATANWAGFNASKWGGRMLASLIEHATKHELASIGQAVVEPHVAVSFVNELGPTGTANITRKLGAWGHEFVDQVAPSYADVVATASHHDDLAFDGRDLMLADTELGGRSSTRADLLLLNPNYNPDFLMPAVVTALGAQRTVPPRVSRSTTAPRSAALQAAVINGVVGDVVAELAADDQLHLLLENDSALLLQNRLGLARIDESLRSELLHHPAIVAFLTVAGADVDAATQIIDYYYRRGQYHVAPLSAELSDIDSNLLRKMRTIEGANVLTGMSMMLAASAPHFAGPTRTGSLEQAVRALLDEKFISVYNTVVASGSGEHLFDAESALLASAAVSQADGEAEVDLTALARLLGVASALLTSDRQQAAELSDRRAGQVAVTLSLLSLAIGGAALAPATKIGAAAGSKLASRVGVGSSAASLPGGSQNTALDTALRHFQQALARGGDIRSAGITALFATGLVRTQSGRHVVMRQAAGGGFRLWVESQAAGDEQHDREQWTEFRLEGIGEAPYQFKDLRSDYPTESELAQLQINQVPLTGFLSQIEAVDSTIDDAHLETVAMGGVSD